MFLPERVRRKGVFMASANDFMSGVPFNEMEQDISYTDSLKISGQNTKADILEDYYGPGGEGHATKVKDIPGTDGIPKNVKEKYIGDLTREDVELIDKTTHGKFSNEIDLQSEFAAKNIELGAEKPRNYLDYLRDNGESVKADVIDNYYGIGGEGQLTRAKDISKDINAGVPDDIAGKYIGDLTEKDISRLDERSRGEFSKTIENRSVEYARQHGVRNRTPEKEPEITPEIKEKKTFSLADTQNTISNKGELGKKFKDVAGKAGHTADKATDKVIGVAEKAGSQVIKTTTSYVKDQTDIKKATPEAR